METHTQIHDQLTILPIFQILKIQIREFLTQALVWVAVLANDAVCVMFYSPCFHDEVVRSEDPQVIRVSGNDLSDCFLYGVELICSHHHTFSASRKPGIVGGLPFPLVQCVVFVWHGGWVFPSDYRRV